MSRTLRDLAIGESGVVTAVKGSGVLRQHLLDMGLIPGTSVTVVKFAPMGDPIEIQIYGYELTLRLAEAEHIMVAPDDEAKSEEKPADKSDYIEAHAETPHPGLGEEGRFHPKGTGNPLPEGTQLTFALVGNQNCGKTTLFNQLTGMNQRVGNFPGVTVDRKDGVIKGHPDTLVTDLPGIYSMSPYSSEELVSRNFVLDEKPKAIINIVDATNIERNLFLTLQLLELNVPMVVALNMMDELSANGGSVDVNAMEEMLGVPVVPISAAKNLGIEELIDHAIHIAKYQEAPRKQDFCDEESHGGAVHRCIHSLSFFIMDHAARVGIPLLFAVNKIIEGDDDLAKRLELDQNEKETILHIVSQMETERGLDRNAAIAEMRFQFIRKVCAASVHKPKESKERNRSLKIDKILTGKFTGIPAFIGVMALIFYLTFDVIGLRLQALIELGVDKVTAIVDNLLAVMNVNPFLHGLVIEGIFGGVGSVLSFIPIIITLFFFLSILEDSGYATRIAFVMDRLLRKIGLSGRSIVPMLIGFGCTVPAVMATRTLPSERDRRMTILLAPFMSCSAKLPIYAFFVSAFFPKNGAYIMIMLYLVGIIFGILIALLYKKILFKGEAVPFVMELPNYRFPRPGNIARLLWAKAKDFLERAFTVILVATLIIWILQSIDFNFHMVVDSEDSMLAVIAGAFAVIMKPVGLGSWQICTSLISGFMAKESVVSTLAVLFDGDVTQVLTGLQAMSMLIFSLLYTPCVAAIAAIKRELGAKWAVSVVFWQCLVAWLASLAVYQIGSLLF
ncbi:MAG: ferrous iron transport protein B [Spirochaetia bacterium]|nr:ferrous iron transport protein B [Spirochaetia bacterium]MBQ3712983.1 ferrous iron transport protein B [Spirochaetia bacterium]